MDQLGIVITGDMRVHVTCLPEFPADVELATDWSHAIFHTDHSTKNQFHQLCTLVCTIKRFELKESVQESLPCCHVTLTKLAHVNMGYSFQWVIKLTSTLK